MTRRKELQLKKILGSANPADIMTKPKDGKEIERLKAEREAAEARLDRIELSTQAREVQSEPDAAREAKLAALRAQVDAGTYRMDTNGVARRIVAREDL